MNFAIPGFQTPESPKQDVRFTARANTAIEFPFLLNRPLDEVMPEVEVYISTERGREINLQAVALTTKYIYEKHDEMGPTKSYWFRLRPEEITIYPGTYQIRFVVGGAEVAAKSVTVEYHPAAPRPFDTATCPWPLTLE